VIVIRPAAAADQPHIQSIVRAARINPFGLHWPRFVVAVDEESGRVVGTGQIKLHGDGSRELASIAVLPERRRQGVASLVIWHLLRQTPGRLYLTCRSRLGSFYERFGFRAVDLDDMPPYFRRLKRLVNIFRLRVRGGDTLLVMKRDPVI
jgi:N-acetylglutamate synthase-like GNAT family acetyltransferase